MASSRYNLTKTQYPNGDIFYGVLVESLRTGFGELRTKDGDILKGQWKMDRLNGVRKISYSNGKEFIGSFLEGVKHGIGQLTIDQKSYTGEFKDGKRTGYGEFNEANFEIRRGKFENGEHNNYGEVELKNTGNVYKGYFKNGNLSDLVSKPLKMMNILENTKTVKNMVMGNLWKKTGSSLPDVSNSEKRLDLGMINRQMETVSQGSLLMEKNTESED